ncbi:hypothetical protein K402DRAFT_398451 [Aulographum hederae CBS 113979]|uniref:Uncharacterized protein n=1 Tax=Aulographum hederae CBS 113979 TaxID=1176131 RepID=A0A6G1GLE3_9PEZI|nr:hypothetical protein K402DRAFT_398451 [Aulographum hederae CBS 113979]
MSCQIRFWKSGDIREVRLTLGKDILAGLEREFVWLMMVLVGIEVVGVLVVVCGRCVGGRVGTGCQATGSRLWVEKDIPRL